MTDVPARNSAAYLEGVTLIHDASLLPGVRTLLRALEADAGLVEARVRLLAYGRKLSEVDGGLRGVRGGRQALGPLR